MDNIVNSLLDEYFKLFPSDGLFPEWEEVTTEDKINMLKEAIEDKKNLSETKIFQEKYEEKVLFDFI